MDCIFCKLASGEIPTEVVYENNKVFAFKDMEPQAPIHYLFIPKKHYTSANDLIDDASVVKDIYEAIALVAKRDGFADKGYRVINNTGKDGGQTVEHLHFHVYAGREMLWPAG